MRRGLALTVSLTLILAPALAAAQPATLTAPVLRGDLAPQLPTDPVDPEGGEVLLEVRIDSTGRVTAASVLRGRGDPWDTAVLAAVRRSVFEPARRDGVPIDARIEIRHRFAPRPAGPPTAGAPEPPAPPAEQAGADDAAAEGTPVDDGGEPTYETVVRARARAPEPVRRTIERREFTRIAGTGGDAVRSVQNMPGVARSGGLSADLIVRGSSPGDTEVFLDGISIPLLYHFGGLTSVVNSDLLSRIDFLPGNFTSRYGRVQGGIVDVVPRGPRDDRAHGVVEIDVIDAGFLAEGPVGQRGSVAVAARRSYVDLFLESLLPEEGVRFTAAPVYWDYQAMGELELGRQDRLRAFVYGSSDRLRLVLEDPSADDPAVRGALSASTLFHRGTVSLEQRLPSGARHAAAISFGYTELAFSLGELVDFMVGTWPLNARDELRFDLGGGSSVTTGLDLQVQYFNVHVKAPPPTTEGQPGEKLSTQPTLETEGDGWITRPAVFLETELRPAPSLRLVPGIRVDYFGELERVAVDPRFSALWQPLERTTFKAGVGAYSQPPTLDQSDGTTFGTLGLSPQRAIHWGLGVEQRLTDRIELGVEGFYKTLSNLVVQVPAESVRGFDYDNDGIGRIYGAELLVRHLPSERLFGWISYTLLRSERRDHPGEPWRLFDFDQTHILTAVAGLTLGAGWEIGARFRLVSGNPMTPVLGAAYYDADADTYVPRYGEPGSVRMPMFHQLDLRVDKKWSFRRWSIAVYLDVQNVYNRQNPEGIFYNFDYTESATVSGLPILPSLGLRGEI